MTALAPVAALASLPDDLWLRVSEGRLDDCDEAEGVEPRPREPGRAVALW
jgi:hypothetical protein